MNGTTGLAFQADTPSTANLSHILSVGTIYSFAANDYVELTAYQSNIAVAARNVLALANYSPEFAIAYLGP